MTGCMSVIVVASGLLAAGNPPATPDDAPYTERSIRGQVVFLNEHLEEATGVRPVLEAADRTLALRTDDGRLLPLLEDRPGRAFRRDERLRNRPLELVVREHHVTPALQVLKVYAVNPDDGAEKRELYYWCEVCAIRLTELMPCDCCQGPIELLEGPIAGEEEETK